jgi:competence protein ComEC
MRVRRWAVATISAQLPESSAALLAGLLLGERTALPPQTDEAFRRAGVYHVLAVSDSTSHCSRRPCSRRSGSSACRAGRRHWPPQPCSLVLRSSSADSLRSSGHGDGSSPTTQRAPRSRVAGHERVELVRAAAARLAPVGLMGPWISALLCSHGSIIYLAAPITGFLHERRTPRWLAAAIAVSLAAQLPSRP